MNLSQKILLVILSMLLAYLNVRCDRLAARVAALECPAPQWNPPEPPPAPEPTPAP